ncbi:nb-arc and tpr domain protein [Diplodia corticola]|uniref:Nb-arc and tpr domain protein n=1 Tax=Diplodia corticola TaxID=236234 RepID=A0A1J9SC97_9PEZI|nr:nb-arc and tpr domain protein [Diplodia corticola]OJD37205.1 nb-arc and tpr domain protein [Diplodia corticola]
MAPDTPKRVDGLLVTSPVITDRWDAVLDLCRTKLDPKDFDIVSRFGSIEELIQFGSALHSRYSGRAKAFELARLIAFFERLRTFHGSFDVLVHVQPTVAAPIWGSIKLCVELVHETNEVFELIVEMFDEIKHTLPRIETYIEVLGPCPSLTEPCQELYWLIAEFSCQVISYFRKNPLKNILFATWKPFRPSLEKTIARIRKKSRQIELEVQTLSLQKNAMHHEEIKDMLSRLEIRTRARLPCHRVPYSKNPAFVGRDEELEEMHNHLSAPSVNQRVVSLYGLGGVGKTQLCLEYLSKHVASYEAAFWISADSLVKLAQDVRVAVTKLGLVPDEAEASDQQCKTVFWNWLQETDASWLLVFDNADDLKVLQGYWPKSKHGHILLNSRDPASARFPVNSKDMKGIHVPPLSESKAAELLLDLVRQSDHCGVDEDVEETELARQLTKSLGGLPLAINQIANYMLESQCDLEEIWDIYSDFRNRASLLDQDAGNLHMDYPHSLNTVWDISMSRVESANKDSRHLLQLLALLDPDGIPESLLTGSDRQRVGSSFARLQYLENKMVYLDTTRPLLQQSLISKDKSRRVVSMHRLVGAITLNKMTQEDRQARFDEAVELLYRVYPQLTPDKASLDSQWPRCRLYLPQVMSLEQFYRESDPPLLPRAEFAVILANASWYLFEQGLPAQAMQILPNAREVGEKTLPKQYPLATIYRTFGGIYLDVNRAGDALVNFSNQLKVLQEMGSPNDLVQAHGYTNVALAELGTGDYRQARKDLDRAQEIRSKYPGQAEGYKGMTLDVIGLLEGLGGDYESSIQHLKAAIELYDADLGAGNYLTAFSNFSLGNIYIRKGDLVEAFKLHTSSLSVRRDILGETYRTAASLHKVAWFLHGRDEQAASEEMLLKALTIYQRSYGGKGGTGRSTYLMSMVLESLGREEDAKNSKKLAADIRQELLGIPPDEQDNMESYDKLVGTLDR